MFNTAEANAGDTNNYDVSREGVGKAADLPDKIAQLYHLVYEGIVPTLDTDQRKAAAILCLTLNAKHLILGINSLYRLYASQMFREARSASESTAIAKMILHDASAYAVFAKDRANDEKARRRVRNLFKATNIFAGVNPYLLKLQDHYNAASQRAHTNRMSLMRHVMTMPSGDESAFSLIEIMPQEANLTIKSYLRWTCRVHMDIIETVTAFIFPEFDANRPEFKAIQQSIDGVMDALAAHIQRLEWNRQQTNLSS
jgi:hypothetical protein